MDKDMYYIGKVEKICNISKKTLRYYDEVGILSPDKITTKNGYRCYSQDTLLSIPIIKYCKQSGFKLEEIKEVLNNGDKVKTEMMFKEKISLLEEEERKLKLKMQSIKDWHSLIKEADFVVNNGLDNITVKFIEKKEMIEQEQEFNYDYRNSILNIEFTNYIEEIENAITGPVILEFSSYKDKMNGRSKKVKIIQKNLIKNDKSKNYTFEEGMFISAYHIGLHKDISKTYEKMLKWAKEKNYTCEEKSYERYVIDYWTSDKEEKFVTEILLKIKS